MKSSDTGRVFACAAATGTEGQETSESWDSFNCTPSAGSGGDSDRANPTLLRLQAEVMQAMSHPTRLQILLALRAGERCVCDFEPILGLRQPNISQHLGILRGANLVVTRREGLNVMYRLGGPDVLRVIDLVAGIVVRHSTELAESVSAESPATR